MNKFNIGLNHCGLILPFPNLDMNQIYKNILLTIKVLMDSSDRFKINDQRGTKTKKFLKTFKIMKCFIWNFLLTLSNFWKQNPELWKINKNHKNLHVQIEGTTKRILQNMAKTVYEFLKLDQQWNRNCRSTFTSAAIDAWSLRKGCIINIIRLRVLNWKWTAL